ncbi:MAG: hypothetical protein ACLPWF_12480 [Bryobacteraceae bacterium]
MPAIVRSAVLLCIAAAFACADAHDDVMDVFTKMAAALTQVNADGHAISGNVAEFMSAVSKDMPDYDTLRNNVTALVNNAEISSSIEPLTEDIEGDTYKIDLDWVLEIRSLERDGPLVRRREVVHGELRKEQKHWKIIALKPVSFFAGASLGK